MNIIQSARSGARKIGLQKFFGAAAKTYAQLFPNQVCTRGEVRWDLDLTRLIDFEIFFGGWEPESIRFLEENVRPGHTVIEVGANIGAHTLPISRLVGTAGRVYAFEPTEYALGKLRKNIALNPGFSGNIDVVAKIVTNHRHDNPISEIQSGWKRDGSSENISEKVSVAAVCIDEFVESQRIARIDLLKIDVDGYDFKVLQGSRESIKANRPVIFIELCEHTLARQGDSVRDIFGFLEELGYKACSEDGKPLGGADEVLKTIGMSLSTNGIFRAA